MKKFLSLMLAVVLVISAAGCSSSSDTDTETAAEETAEEQTEAETEASADVFSGYTAGTYTGTANGLSGEITVSVTFDDESITDIEIVESNETPYMMETVSSVIPAAIIETQSLAVDTVTGATYASRGVINAVADCVDQAGGDVDSMKVPLDTEYTEETMDVDVVVVGAGLTGLMTAAVLKDSGVDNVIVIEMQGMVGGSGVYSAGQMFGAIEEEDLDYVRNVYMEHTMDYPVTEGSENYPNMDKVDILINEGHNTFDYFRSKGWELAYTDMNFLDTPGDTRVYVINEAAEEAGITSAGQTLVWSLQQLYEGMGGEILTETTATDLIVDETGAVKGVHATTPTGTLTINAEYTVMCTGSAGRGQDVLEEYFPELADGEVRVLTMGSDGSGIQMMADIGADVYDNWIVATAGVFSVDPTSQLSNDSKNISITNVKELYVDTDGIRPCAEFTEGSSVYYFMKAGVEDSVWVILDSALAEELDVMDEIEQGLEQYPSRFFTADSIEELAEITGLPQDNLVETVATYNSYCEAGEDADYGKDPENLIAIDEAPYYAVRYSITGKEVAGGVVSNNTCQVLDTDGNVIEGLYACGHASSRDYYGTSFVGSVGLQVAVTTGRIAAQDIAERLAE